LTAYALRLKRFVHLSKFMADPISSPGKTPLDVEMGAADAAGTAFQATLICHADAVFFQSVNVGRTDVETGLVRTFFQAKSTIDNPQVRFFIHPEPVQE
jgi:hypothetical protein